MTDAAAVAGDPTIDTRTFAYDPLDRLRLADYGTAGRTRFRYVGLTASVAQAVDDATGSVIRSVGNSWTGERLEDWTGSGSNLRVYGTNGHNDVTWAAGPSGAVTGTARYDPWGTATSVTGSMPDFRFQGSWADGATGLSWAVTRWYAPAQGRFISEDSLPGEPRDPDSRHLYAYGAGEPVGRWDPDGRFWYRVKTGDTLGSIALRYLGSAGKWPTVWNANRGLVTTRRSVLWPGTCLWVRRALWTLPQCLGRAAGITGGFPNDSTREAVTTLHVDWYNLTAEELNRLTQNETHRDPTPSGVTSLTYTLLAAPMDAAAAQIRRLPFMGGHVDPKIPYMTVVTGSLLPGVLPGGFAAITIGHTVFWDGVAQDNWSFKGLMSHEYIHVLQQEAGGFSNLASYGWNGVLQAVQQARFGGPRNRNEAIGYLWEGWINQFGKYGEKPSWCSFRPTSGTVAEC